MRSALALACFTLIGAGYTLKYPGPPEKVPEGCQNLESRPFKPIPLRGKIYATYLPDGRRYTKLRPPAAPDYFEMGVLDLDATSPRIRRLTRDEVHDAEVALSPDGRRMVWSRRPALDLFDDWNAILIANTDMTDIRVVAYEEKGYLGIPTFAGPHRIMYSRQTDDDEFTSLIFLDLRTWTTKKLRTRFRGSISDPQLSPDGRRIVFKSFEQPDNPDAQLYIMNADGTRVRRLTHNEFQDEDPAFSPDGRTIVFERAFGLTDHQGDNPEDYYFQVGIVSLDLTTGRETVLTEPDPCGKNELWLPTWSPDGELIMMTRGLHLENGEFTHDLWVMRKDGSDLQKVPGSDGIMFFDWVW